MFNLFQFVLQEQLHLTASGESAHQHLLSQCTRWFASQRLSSRRIGCGLDQSVFCSTQPDFYISSSSSRMQPPYLPVYKEPLAMKAILALSVLCSRVALQCCQHCIIAASAQIQNPFWFRYMMAKSMGCKALTTSLDKQAGTGCAYCACFLRD